MLNGLFINHWPAIFVGILFCLVLWRVISSSMKSRKEKPDPPAIFGPIRGMFVCYQCDTVFNTPQCPTCREEAVIPLIQLTGSITEDGRIANVLSRLQERNSWKLPALLEVEEGAPAPRPKPSNGGVSDLPVTFPVLRQERGRELS